MLYSTSTHAAVDNPASSTRPGFHLRIGDWCSDNRSHISASANVKALAECNLIDTDDPGRQFARMTRIEVFAPLKTVQSGGKA